MDIKFRHAFHTTLLQKHLPFKELSLKMSELKYLNKYNQKVKSNIQNNCNIRFGFLMKVLNFTRITF